MATKENYDQYAAEFAHRFEELMKWAIENWPRQEYPLLKSDFSLIRREVSQIIGPKLGDGESGDSPLPRRENQYRPTNPMPWP